MGLAMQRVRGLDGVRGFAAIWVILDHFYAQVPKAAWLTALPGVARFASFGWVGVSLFFVLSGYLIVPQLLAAKDEPHFFRNFWCRRVCRLAPAYVMFLLLYLAADAFWPAAGAGREPLLGPTVPFWSFWLMIQNVLMASAESVGNLWLRVSWTLAVEVQFYVLIGVIVYVTPKDRLLRWLVALAAGAVIFRYVVALTNPTARAPLVLLMPSRLDAFMIGGILALLAAREPAADPRGRQWAALGVLAACTAVFAWFVAGGFGETTRQVVPVYHLILAAGCGAFLELARLSSPSVGWLTEHPFMMRAGRLSYFVYLFHTPVIWGTFALLAGAQPNLASPGSLAVMIAAWTALAALAELSYRLIESPMIRRGQVWTGAGRK